MGTIRNRMTIIYHWDFEEIKQVHEDALACFEELMNDYRNIEDYDVAEKMISPILQSPINAEYSFVIMGDCSKIGWEMSESFERFRYEWVKKHISTVKNILIVDFGEGDLPAYIEEIN